MAAAPYFAYGSNLHPARLAARIGDVELIGVGSVAGRRLAFHKRGMDGSAKCDLAPSDDPGGRVWGALYRLTAGQRERLAPFEGLGAGYAEERVVVAAGGDEVEAIAFRAQAAFIDPELRPFSWYRDLVLAGARFHGFPATYVAAIASVVTIRDPDPARDRRNREPVAGFDPRFGS